ncbi:hypothetical protein [Halalkalibacter akibai]|uniref:GNAT family N-acetyltransferase n=1 Tax=Halalkalibacter akibai (strain ATCC 43226 / DSM 21942 / CIP 109018 / JCM 9157 / 1139) TaxID=1236973 RepID=W4QVJ9_HALA3|nr:hypothetical protein [Halalkalibacter akibai]GAE35658.1 hypothetical protein JCM9157_2775 [Halalkalibacter akibai JCM 9157]
MKIVSLKSHQWEQYRRPILNFVKRYDHCDVKSTYSWLFHFKKHDLLEPGTSIQLALWEGKIIAVAAVSDYGTTHSTIVVSPRYLPTQVQVNLYNSLLDELGVCYTKIRYDDQTKIKFALQAGLVCFAYLKGEENEIYLWFGGGHWHTTDITEKEA